MGQDALPPPRFLFWLVSLDLLAATLAMGLGFAVHGDPTIYMGEDEPVTYLSFAHLLVTGSLASVIFRLRMHGRSPLLAWRDQRWIWLLLAVGFLFLAVDEVAILHESFDQSVHRMLHLRETGLSDRLDDAIILGYGVLGAVVLYIYRVELADYRKVLPLVVCGGILVVYMQILDMLTNRNDIFMAGGIEGKGQRILLGWIKGIEDTLKLCADAALLASMYACAFITVARRDSGRAYGSPRLC